MSEEKKNWSEFDVFRLIEQKHAQDVVVGGCKNGPSHGGKLLIMDAWVMRRSWTRWNTFGYEIKVSRSDFLRDDKWPGYLPYCHQFYFAAPPGVIQPDELPPEAGLLVATKTGGRLLTKKKAPRRDVTIPEDLWIYIVMCRAFGGYDEIERESRDQRIARWRDWLEMEMVAKDVGRGVRGKVGVAMAEMANEVDAMREKVKRYEYLDSALKRLGIDERIRQGWWFEQEVKRKLDELRRVVPHHLLKSLASTRDMLGGLIESIGDNIVKKPEGTDEDA